LFTHLFWRKVGLSFARAFTVTLALGLLPVIDSVAGEGAYDIDAGRKALVALVVASPVRRSSPRSRLRLSKQERGAATRG
jgi:hypothetical protein